MERLIVAQKLITFDCGDIYTGVEAFLGQFGRGLKIHTKFVPDKAILPQIDKNYVTRIIDRSLNLLKRDQLDLLQFHWWDYTIPRYLETAYWQSELQNEGKISHLGFTNFDVKRAREFSDNGIKFQTAQIQYSILDQRSENGFLGFCQQNQIAVICHGYWVEVLFPINGLERMSLTGLCLKTAHCRNISSSSKNLEDGTNFKWR